MKKKKRRAPARDSSEAASFELLWHGRGPVTRGPKPAFDLGDVVAAGADIADHDGLPALTMAAVAERLGLTPMALYRYVPSKGALVDLVADSVLTRPPRPSRSSWRADIVAWVRAHLALVRRHPWIFDIISTRACAGPNWARWLDAGLQCLEGLPLSASEKLAMLLLVDGHARASAQLMVGAKATAEWASSFGNMLQEAVGNPRYPALAAMLAAGDFEQPSLDLQGMFDFGLERLLDGIEELVRARTSA